MLLASSFFTDTVMPFLQQTLFNVAGFEVLMWHAIAVGAVVLLILIIIQ